MSLQRWGRNEKLSGKTTDRLNVFNTFESRASQLNGLQHEINRLISVTKGDLPDLGEFDSQLDDVLKQELRSSARYNDTQRALVPAIACLRHRAESR